MVGSASGIRRRYRELSPVLDERGRRRFAATEARAYGYGGVSVVSRITGLARSTIARGVEESIEDKLAFQTAPSQCIHRLSRLQACVKVPSVELTQLAL